jgi:DNA-binding PadR family transcriptional regulator
VSRPSADELTTTSYALLGMLAIRPWTTYELAKHMKRSLDPTWPRARSHLFKEPKKLVAHGLATASGEMTGKRPRTVYTITAKGRRALRTWLGTAGEGPVLEFEQFLKVFFAENGTREGLLAVLRGIEEWAQERNEENIAVARSYLTGTGPFPERFAILSLTGKFLGDYVDMVLHWAQWAISVVEGWPDDLREAEPQWAVMEEYARRGDVSRSAG